MTSHAHVWKVETISSPDKVPSSIFDKGLKTQVLILAGAAECLNWQMSVFVEGSSHGWLLVTNLFEQTTTINVRERCCVAIN